MSCSQFVNRGSTVRDCWIPSQCLRGAKHEIDSITPLEPG